MKKQIIYLEIMPKDLKIETHDMIIIGTGELYNLKEEQQHEGLLSQKRG